MRIVQWLKKRLAPQTEIDDADLGLMTSRDETIWKGTLSLFNPSLDIYFLLEGNAAGPSSKSRRQVGELRKRWRHLMATTIAEELLFAERTFDGAASHNVENVYEEYEASHGLFQVRPHVHYRMDGNVSDGIDVPVEHSHLEIYFWKADNPEHQLVIHIIDWVGQGYGIDADAASYEAMREFRRRRSDAR